MRLRSLFFFVNLFTTFSLFAQDAWHRNYALTGGDTIQVSGGAISGGGAYYNVGAYIKEGIVEALQVNGFNAKGDVQWSQLIYSADSIPFASLGSIVFEDNKLYVSASVGSEQENKALFVLDNRGNPLYTKYYTNGEDDIPADSKVENFVSDDVLLGTSTLVSGEVRASVSRIDQENGDILWNRSFGHFDDNGNIPADVLNLNFFPDSTISVIGQTINSTGTAVTAYISSLDTLGGELWSKNYLFNDPNPYQLGFFNSKLVTDTTSVAVGRIFVQDPDPTALRFNGIVTYVDSIGNELWTKEVIFPGLSLTIVYDAVVGPNGNINIYGETADLILQEGFGFVLTLDQDGNQVQLVVYDESPVLVPFGPSIDMVGTPDNGAAVFTSTLDNESILPAIVKLSESMNTPCDTLFENEVIEDIKLIVEDISWVVDDVMDGIDSISTVLGYGGISVPTLSLEDSTFCPQIPIILELDAFQNEATEYLWSTGETTPQITVTEEGMYLVTVTMGEDVCYTLCDTVTVDKHEFPEAIAEPFCRDDEILLGVNLTQGAGLQSVAWSNGEDQSLISVESVASSYMVTVTDNCDNTTEASVSIEEPSASIDFIEDPDGECAAKTLIAVYQSSINMVSGNVALEYLWNTNETTPTIEIAGLDTFMVTIDDNCGFEPVMASFVNTIDDETVRWPSIFFPGGMEDLNRTFGPAIECPELIEEYELHVYNRWGNEVFESTSLDDEWNGQHNEENAPTAIYVYWARYTINGQEFTDKGDVNLMR